GIWEMRGEPQHYLHSRLMCWVAVDRAVRLGAKRSLAMPRSSWVQARDAIRSDIRDNFWHQERGHFVVTRHGEYVDAAMLLMPLVRFVGA
ncbi:glycoside hydrolase family 15 protein, partial [Erwinia amylovora]|uniref:glycoside hydrolase family 15 protein n=1 Tax=Erwinia amylovora TaxID=552 RepID=UPI0020BF0CCF